MNSVYRPIKYPKKITVSHSATSLKTRLPIRDRRQHDTQHVTKNFRFLFVIFYCSPITRKLAKSFYMYLHYNCSRVVACRVSVNAPLHHFLAGSQLYITENYSRPKKQRNNIVQKTSSHFVFVCYDVVAQSSS